MSRLLENKKFLAGHIKVIYALSNIKIYPKYKTNHNADYRFIGFRYAEYDIYPYSNSEYRGRLDFKSQKELIETILNWLK